MRFSAPGVRTTSQRRRRRDSGGGARRRRRGGDDEEETTVSDEEETTTHRTTTVVPRVFSRRRYRGRVRITNIKLTLSLLSCLCRSLRSLGFLMLLHVDRLAERVETVVSAVDSNGGVASRATQRKHRWTIRPLFLFYVGCNFWVATIVIFRCRTISSPRGLKRSSRRSIRRWYGRCSLPQS